jgi:hypothetical protein
VREKTYFGFAALLIFLCDGIFIQSMRFLALLLPAFFSTLLGKPQRGIEK